VRGVGITAQTADFRLDGQVHEIGFKGYNYRNILTNARVAAERFDGFLQIDDPNLQMTARPPGYGGTGTGGYNDAPGATPFILAANAADVEMMRMLLAAGADPHLVTRTKSNALLAATGLNRGIGEIIDDEDRALKAVTFLLDVGVDPKAVTTYDENALFGPAYRGWNRMIELLIEKGAEVNMANKAGVTPWLAASGFGDRLGGVLFNKAGADILLKHGADPKLGHPCQAQNRCRPE